MSPAELSSDRNALYANLVLYYLRLELALGEGRQSLPAYLGSTIRGLIAASFRDLVCVTQALVCEGCLLLNRCAYPYMFETPPPLHAPEALRKRFQQAPRPYIFNVPRMYRGEPTLDLGLVLVGRAIDYLPYVIYVIQETGKKGLGRARVPYHLTTVTDGGASDGALIFSAAHGIVQEEVQPLTTAALFDPGDAQMDEITLDFLTPLRIKKFGAYQEHAERLDFAVLIDFLLGRLETLAFFHCDQTGMPSNHLREAAGGVQVRAKDMRLQRLQRYSNRRNQKLPLDGLVGTMRFQGHLAPFLPILRMGTYVHIGAGTAFGLGRYRLQNG